MPETTEPNGHMRRRLVNAGILVTQPHFAGHYLRSKSDGNPVHISAHELAEYVPPPRVVVEAGAMDGGDTVELATMWPQATIYAFEPVPELFDRLVANTAHLPNVRPQPFALGDSDGTADMVLSNFTAMPDQVSGSSSLLPPTGHLDLYRNVEFGASIQVQVRTLDTWARETGVDRVDVAVLDMQGMELPTLAASPRIVAGLTAVSMEVARRELYEGAPLRPQIVSWLADQGFRTVLDRTLVPYGNMLFVRPPDSADRPHTPDRALRTWDFTDTTEHLSATDLFMAQQILDRRTQASVRVIEVGVWKGAWLLLLLRGNPRAHGYGIDPYPQMPQIRDRLLADVEAHRLGNRFDLADSREAFCAAHCAAGHVLADVIHIDGEHSEAAVEADLAFAARHTTPDGVIVVDDYRFAWFPGIASALYGFLADREWAAFLFTANKAYLTRAANHESELTAVGRVLDAAGLPWSRGIGVDEAHPARYTEAPDVRGFGVALCLSPVCDELLLQGRRAPLSARMRTWRARWEPPLRDSMRPFKRRLVALRHLRR